MQRLRSSCLDLARAWIPRASAQAECSSAAPLWARLSSSAAAAGSAEAPSALTGLQSVKKALRPQARAVAGSGLAPVAAAAAPPPLPPLRSHSCRRHLHACRTRAATPSAAPGPSSCRSRRAAAAAVCVAAELAQPALRRRQHCIPHVTCLPSSPPFFATCSGTPRSARQGRQRRGSGSMPSGSSCSSSGRHGRQRTRRRRHEQLRAALAALPRASPRCGRAV